MFKASTFEISTDNIFPSSRRTNGRAFDNSVNSMANNLEPEIAIIIGEIDVSTDQLQENILTTDINSIDDVSEIDRLLNDAKLHRSNLIKLKGRLLYIKPEADASISIKLINDCKDFIKSLADRKSIILNSNKYLKSESEDVITKFSHISALKNVLDIAFNRFSDTCKIDVSNLDNADLTILNEGLPTVREDFRELCRIYCDFVEKCPIDMPDRQNMFNIYDDKIKKAESFRATYELNILVGLKERELTSDKIKNPTNEIKLDIFRGYKSGPDFYSFKTQFLNKFRRYTKVDKLSILKNTYLKDEAYNTAKEIHDIDEVWNRLKEEFGDPKFMLRSKISCMLNAGNFNKCKTVSDKREAALKTVNILTDMFNLVEQHNLQIDLYCKNEKAINCMLKQLPRLWLHDWHYLKIEKLSKFSSETDVLVRDESVWKLFKQFLQNKLQHLKEEESIEESLKEFSFDKTHEYKRNNVCDVAPCDDIDEYEINFDYFDNSFNNYPYKSDSCENDFCVLCKDSKKHSHYWDCHQFMNMKHGERYELFVNPINSTSKVTTIGKLMGECAACLVPGEKVGHGCHLNEYVKEWLCPFKHQRPLHILCCRHHADDNIHLWEKFQYNTKYGFLKGEEFIPTWKRSIKWKNNLCKSLYNDNLSSCNSDVKIKNHTSGKINDDGLFLLQRIQVDGEIYNIFYDSGCSDCCISESAVQRLKSRAKLVRSGKFDVTGAGGGTVCTSNGIFEINLPLANGNQALFTGLCLSKLTVQFPEYKIFNVYEEIRDDFIKTGGDTNDLPIYDSNYICGGETDIMIGIKYNRYQPKLIHQMESGLAIYKSSFTGKNGSDAVIAGPHPVISMIEKEFFDQSFNQNCKDSSGNFISHEYIKNDSYDIDFKLSMYNASSTMKIGNFHDFENAGTDISYRCLKCRDCPDCKCGIVSEEISRNEEIEQYLIDKSIHLDTEKCRIDCSLPLNCDPEFALGSSNAARKVFMQWRKKLQKNPVDLVSVVKSENKLQNRGHVDFLKNLNYDQQKYILECPFQYILPWRPVWKTTSQTTPCRITFDAGSKTNTGKSLNDILPKGINQINSLLEVILRWRYGLYAMASDIEQMYNGLKLFEKHWPLQLYWWDDDLHEDNEPELKVIKTLIYGVRSSGGQAIKGVKMLAEKYKLEYPDVHNTLTKQIYVDDILPEGQHSLENCYKLADELTVVLARGGLNLKRFVFSGEIPHSSVSDDGLSINVGGMLWFPVSDHLQLQTGKLNFSQKYRGKFVEKQYTVPSKLTRRICTSKVGEVFDILGRFVPIIGKLKLDLHYLVIEKYDWDDIIPEEIRKIWISNFELIQQLDEIQFHRAIVPKDAIDLNIETIEAGDASAKMICVAIYARFKLKSGLFSCQLVLGKSKLVPSGMSIPRAELLAAKINSSAGCIVKRAFGQKIIRSWKITDSKIVMFWINSWKKSLKIWTYNCVNEILRLSNVKDWFLISTNLMPCDIGTRGSSQINDVKCGSTWINGYPWMCNNVASFPIRDIGSIQLESLERDLYEKELVPSTKLLFYQNKLFDLKIQDHIKERLMFSNYLLEPNKFRFKKAVRIMGLVFKFLIKISKVLTSPKFWFLDNNKFNFKVFNENFNINYEESCCNWSSRLNCYISNSVCTNITSSKSLVRNDLQIYPTDHEIQMALQYFYKITTKEVDEFSKNSKSYKESIIIDGIRFWKGRLLESHEYVHADRNLMTSVMADMSPSMFCVPLVDQFSPVAWSIIYEIHWFNNIGKHSGVATTKRISREYAYIVKVREICDLFRKLCSRCRWIEKQTLSVEFGPLSSHQLTIAPAFYICQVDLMGPFAAYQINVRSTLKIWFAIYVCVVTSTVSIQVMENCSTGSFICSFIRFSSQNGYPKTVLSDQGQNIENGIKNMEINWSDVKGQLHYSYGIELHICGVGGHHQHGKVERKIRHIKSSFLKSFDEKKISVLQWQTVADETANCINNLPIGVGSSRNINLELDDLDVITPNRLKFGRNNDRCPTNPIYISNDPFKFIDTNIEIFNCWWEHWLISAVPELIERPKDWKPGRNMMKGDVIIFLKTEGKVISTGLYHYGIIDSIITGKDGIVRNVFVRYRNANEQQDRITKRSVKSLIVIHCVDELDIMKELYEASQYTDKLKNNSNTGKL